MARRTAPSGRLRRLPDASRHTRGSVPFNSGMSSVRTGRRIDSWSRARSRADVAWPAPADLRVVLPAFDSSGILLPLSAGCMACADARHRWSVLGDQWSASDPKRATSGTRQPVEVGGEFLEIS